LASERRRLRAWLLAPYPLGVAAVVAAFAVIEAAGTNRTALDKWLGIFAVGTLLAAGPATVAALLLHPWRGAARADWLLLLLHIAGWAALLAAVFAWVAAHLA
jgi:hypothetical protein